MYSTCTILMCICDHLDIGKYYLQLFMLVYLFYIYRFKKSEFNVLHLSLSCTGQLKELKNAADQGASIPLPEGNEEDDLEDDLDIEVCSYDL